MKAQWLNSCDMVSTCGLNSIMAALQMFKIVCWYLSLSPFDCGKYGIESINLIWFVWWKDSRMFGWKALSLPPMMALMLLLIAYNKFRVEINASITVTSPSISSKKKILRKNWSRLQTSYQRSWKYQCSHGKIELDIFGI